MITNDAITLSRRGFLAGVVPLTIAGGMIVSREEETFFKLFPVGRVEIKGESCCIRIFDRYSDALLGLEEWSHVVVLYWFHKNDVVEKRRILRVHPKGDEKNPLTGVFACRAPVRPNLIALSVCRILSIDGNRVHVEKIDAFDGTPVLDLKPYIPPDMPAKDVRVPEWLKKGKKE